MPLIPYQRIPQHRGTKAQFCTSAQFFPWCFPDYFISKDRRPGIAPVVGVRFSNNTPLPFIAAIAPTVIQQTTSSIPPLKRLQNLDTALGIVSEWLRDNLPLWLQQLTKPAYELVLLNTLDGEAFPNVDGGSVGLSAVLARISQLLQAPLPIDWMYSATVSTDGHLGPVNALKEKIDGALQMCPHVKHFVVGQISEAEYQALCQHFNSRIVIHRCHNIQAALECILLAPEQSIQDMIQSMLAAKVQRNALELTNFAEDIFFAVQQGWSQIYGWGSLYRTLEEIYISAINTDTLPQKTRFYLEMSLLIACRYRSNPNNALDNQPPCIIQLCEQHLKTGPIVLTFGEWYGLLPHLLQQLTDRPDLVSGPRLLIEIITSHLPPKDLQWYTPLQLRLIGAWGRHLGKIGSSTIAEAYRWQKLAFHHWFMQGIYYDASYPLCAMMALSLELPENRTEVLHLWELFKRKPNSKFQHIIQFMPTEWRQYILHGTAFS